MKKTGFIRFVNERQAIFNRRIAELPKPWTKDKILQQYRFCNVYRENDAVTQWIAHNWRKPHREDPDLWFAMVVARYLNDPSTLKQLRYPVPWNKRDFYHMIEERQEDGLRIYNPAYIVVPSATSMPKHEYLAERVFTPLWKARAKVRPRQGDTLESFYLRLNAFQGMGTFMTAQVIADLKYATLFGTTDWLTFAKSGPGSKRGMNRVLGNPPRAAISEKKWYAALHELWVTTKGKIPNIHMQDLQNCLCEFDKYERVRLGEGTPKQKYNGAR